MKTFSQFLLGTSLICLFWTVAEENPFKNFTPYASVWLWSLPENDEITPVKNWKTTSQELTKSQYEQFQKRLATRYNEIRQYITPERIQKLSRWANDEMKYYRPSIPNYRSLKWNVIKCAPTNDKFLLETTLETLPSPHLLAKRWLKAYAVFNTENGYIEWCLITIHGEIRE
ncbi:MAG: hypothetical protein Q4C96_06415 [Planctomycetia bacterium]|nr:hypothetical protein [Planctomycetia bacterium]